MTSNPQRAEVTDRTISQPSINPATEDCPSCDTPAGHHCQTWCDLNGTAWDEVE